MPLMLPKHTMPMQLKGQARFRVLNMLPVLRMQDKCHSKQAMVCTRPLPPLSEKCHIRGPTASDQVASAQHYHRYIDHRLPYGTCRALHRVSSWFMPEALLASCQPQLQQHRWQVLQRLAHSHSARPPATPPRGPPTAQVLLKSYPINPLKSFSVNWA